MYPKTLSPTAPRPTQYGMNPKLLKMRAAELPGMTSISNKELFPEITDVIYPGDISLIRKHTKASIDTMDLSKIQPGDSVNIIGAHHGFTLYGGEPYAEMIRTIKDEVQRKTGTTDIRLRLGNGLRFRESEEYIKSYKMDAYFDNKVTSMAPIDKGIPIETEIGTLYGLERAYDAKWIIQAHNSDVRELHVHRLVDRIVKAFGMSYARIETRSTFHRNLGPRGANFVARAIYESPFVQEKFIGSVIMKTSPSGIIGIDGDNDLLRQNVRITEETLNHYGKLVRLLNKIEDCIAIIDYPGPIVYTSAGGLIFGNILSAHMDLFDLRNPFPPLASYREGYNDRNGIARVPGLPVFNPAVKMVVNNYSFKGYMGDYFAEQIPTILVGQGMQDLFETCEMSPRYTTLTMAAKDLESGVEFAQKAVKTKNVIAVDGVVGGLNVSESLRDFLLSQVANVQREVDEELMPLWLAQRGLRKNCS